jgi:chromosome segregation ATPase
MDTMKILLGATAALLLGALVMSWNNTQTEVKNAPKSEIDQLKAQITELRLEQDRIQQEKQLQQLKASIPTPTTYQPPSEIQSAELKAKLAETERQLAEVQAAREKAERDAKVFDQENAELTRGNLEKGDNELRRARMISQALLVGKVREYVETPEVGGFATIEIVMPEQIQAGTILSIRKNTGILGQLRVTEVNAEGAIATPMPGFGPTKPQPGDELINPPPF